MEKSSEIGGLLLAVEIAAQASEQDVAELQRRLSEELAAVAALPVAEMEVLTPAALDPTVLRELVVLLDNVKLVATESAGAIGAAALLLGALERFVKACGSMVRTVAVEIGGKRRPIGELSKEDIAEELKPASPRDG